MREKQMTGWRTSEGQVNALLPQTDDKLLNLSKAPFKIYARRDLLAMSPGQLSGDHQRNIRYTLIHLGYELSQVKIARDARKVRVQKIRLLVLTDKFHLL